jgi:hypothetical protein
MFILNTLLLVAVHLSFVAAQTLPFLVTGFLDRYTYPLSLGLPLANLVCSATPKDGSAINRGGTVQISGFSVTIPDNLLVEFPALFVPCAEFCAGKRAPPNEVTVCSIANSCYVRVYTKQSIHTDHWEHRRQ